MISTTAHRELGPPPAHCQWQPWAKWNLFRNPFGECTRAERVKLAILDEFDGISLNPLTQPRTAVQFIGPCGRGKTTRLLTLQARLPESFYVYLAENMPIPAIPSGEPLIIDEAQRLTAKVRKTIFRSGLPLILGTHRDLSRALRRFGYHVTTHAIDLQNTPELIHRALNRRIEASRMTDQPIPEISISEAEQLHRRFGSDLRSIEGHLYEIWQTELMSL